MSDERVTRRTILKAGGGLVAMAALGTTGIGMAWAQGTSPASAAAGGGFEGMWLAVRNRSIIPGTNADDMVTKIREGYVPLIREIPGFVAYIAMVDPNSQASAWALVFKDKAGADESTARAGTWLKDNKHEWFEGDPHVVEGSIGIAAGGFAGGAPAASLEGNIVAMRSRKLKDAAAAEALEVMVRDGFMPLVTAVPGFIAYAMAANEQTLDQVSIGVFKDKAGADASTVRAQEWGTEGATALTTGDPVVFEGAIKLVVTA